MTQRDKCSGQPRTAAKSVATGKWARPRLYRCWCSMRNRCRNPRAQNFHRYGGRGISICPQWDVYEIFREWAIATGYRKGLTLDRINNDGNYEPDNCRWVTKSMNSSKVTPSQVRAIRADRRHPNEIAEEYNLHPSWVVRLQRRERRTDV